MAPKDAFSAPGGIVAGSDVVWVEVLEQYWQDVHGVRCKELPAVLRKVTNHREEHTLHLDNPSTQQPPITPEQSKQYETRLGRAEAQGGEAVS